MQFKFTSKLAAYLSKLFCSICSFKMDTLCSYNNAQKMIKKHCCMSCSTNFCCRNARGRTVKTDWFLCSRPYRSILLGMLSELHVIFLFTAAKSKILVFKLWCCLQISYQHSRNIKRDVEGLKRINKLLKLSTNKSFNMLIAHCANHGEVVIVFM